MVSLLLCFPILGLGVRMNKIIFLIFLVGCASDPVKKVDSSYVGALTIGTDGVSKPNFHIKEFQSKASRAPANIAIEQDSYSNKQLYFLGLYHQYVEFQNFLNLEKERISCPAFHNELVTHETNLDAINSRYNLHVNVKPVIDDPTLLPNYPVMSLPFNDSDVFTYIRNNQSESSKVIIKEAVFKYTENLKSEIHELCQKGASDNYFIYENYVTYAPQDSSLDNNSKKLTAALKIPIFANLLILDNLRDKAFFNHSTYAEKALSRASLSWLKNYLYDLNKVREHREEITYIQN